jgi:hypothetical protein
MDYSDVKSRLAPCGLDCSRCADYVLGEIKDISTRLVELLGNYSRVAMMKKEANPVFEYYRQFDDVLKEFSSAGCTGCRGAHVLCPIECSARFCHKDNNVDFCFQCAQYPCDKQFSGKLKDRWLSINDRMKEIGPVAYYEEQAKQPRY